jgi:hypothetical protein
MPINIKKKLQFQLFLIYNIVRVLPGKPIRHNDSATEKDIISFCNVIKKHKKAAIFMK